MIIKGDFELLKKDLVERVKKEEEENFRLEREALRREEARHIEEKRKYWEKQRENLKKELEERFHLQQRKLRDFLVREKLRIKNEYTSQIYSRIPQLFFEHREEYLAIFSTKLKEVISQYGKNKIAYVIISPQDATFLKKESFFSDFSILEKEGFLGGFKIVLKNGITLDFTIDSLIREIEEKIYEKVSSCVEG